MKDNMELFKKAKNIDHPNSISCGVTWVDSRILTDPNKRLSQKYFGICHYSEKVFAITPLDWQKATMITTIAVSPTENYCERSGMCLYFKCGLNTFNKDEFVSYFKDCGALSLGLPQDLGTKDLWMNTGRWGQVWAKLLAYFNTKPEGGTLKYDEHKGNQLRM